LLGISLILLLIIGAVFFYLRSFVVKS
jgi:hypothetical protein